MPIQKLHHVAYRCRDARETVDFYTEILELDYTAAAAENTVPSTGEHSPYMHIFFRMADGSYVAFFELPEAPEMGRDENTPNWVQHLALTVENEDELERFRKKLVEKGIDIVGPTDHKICKSIYFFDPNGHRLEIAVDTTTAEMAEKLAAAAGPMLDEWSLTKKAPQHTRWLHS